ncbi:MAG: GDSL-type esterase/lipase family protein [Parvicellaceae bacterium]
MNFPTKKLNLLFFTLLFSLLISSCKKNRDTSEEDDSYESYRYELWKNLIDYNYNFDFVGRQTDNGTYAEYSGQVFDYDHEGAGGYQSEDVLDNIDEVLSSISNPDIVLLSIGGNDLLDGGNPPSEPISNISLLIDKLQIHNSNITIFLEQIAPANNSTMTSSLTANITDFNSQIATLSANKTTSTSKVIALDMNSDFSESFLADDVHYNELGAKFIADIYFTGIQAEYSNTSSINILPLGDSRVEGNRQ